MALGDAASSSIKMQTFNHFPEFARLKTGFFAFVVHGEQIDRLLLCVYAGNDPRPTGFSSSLGGYCQAYFIAIVADKHASFGLRGDIFNEQSELMP